jgi:hypothetical protein
MTTHFLPADMQLTVTPAALSTGFLVRLSDAPGGEPYAPVALAASTPVTVGPFATPRRYDVITTTGSIAVAINEVAESAAGNMGSQSPDAVAITGGTISGAVIEIGTETGVKLLAGEGPPDDFVAAIAADLTFDSTAANSDLTFTAVVAGAAGNSLTVTIVQPVTLSAELEVTYVAPDAIISLPTDGSGDPVAATAEEVKTAWDLSDAAEVMDCEFEGTGAGEVDAETETPLADGADQVDGTGYGVASTGSLYSDYDTPGLYFMTGTVEEPAWFEIATS